MYSSIFRGGVSSILFRQYDIVNICEDYNDLIINLIQCCIILTKYMVLVSPYTSRPLVNQWCPCMGSNLVPYDYKSNEQSIKSIMPEQSIMNLFYFLVNPG